MPASGLIGSVLLLAGSDYGALRRVPQEYATIQAALDATVDEDTVLISLGTYAEELTAPPLHFWILGDVEIDTGDFERPTIDPSSLDSAQARKCLFIPPQAEVTVEKMRFVNRAPMYPRVAAFASGGIVVNSEQPATFSYCAFDSVYRAIVHDGQPPHVHLVVDYCLFNNAPRIQVKAPYPGRAEVRHSRFHGFHCVSEFVIGSDSSIVEECVFTGDSVAGLVFLQGSNLVVRNCVFGPVDSLSLRALVIESHHQAVIEGNIFQNLHGSDFVASISYTSGEPLIFRRNLITHNTVYQNGTTAVRCRYSQEPHAEYSILLDSNVFADNQMGPGYYNGKALTLEANVQVVANRFLDLRPDSVASVANYPWNSLVSRLRYNLFEASDYAVGSLGGIVDAAWNYWGHFTGPNNATYNPLGQGARIDDNVLFDPWCPDTNCFESAPNSPSILHPSCFVLSCYPNPFNSTLHLTLIPAEVGIVKVELFDVLGRQVSEIWHGPLAFQKEITFNASALTSGIYFARVADVISRKNLAMTKLVLLK